MKKTALECYGFTKQRLAVISVSKIISKSTIKKFQGQKKAFLKNIYGNYNRG